MLPLTDPILVFTILLSMILLAPLLADRIRVPDLVLLLAAGAILGPKGFEVLARGDAVRLFGEIGLLYIMFLAGLEIDLHRFAQTRNRCISFGILTFLIPQGLGTLAGYYILGFNWSASLLLASMFASHTLLAYPLAGRLGITKSEPVAVTVGATILTDTLALLVLAVIAGSARDEGLGLEFWGMVAVGLAALVALSWWGIPSLTRWFFLRVSEAGGAQFLFVIATVCGFSYLSHYAKMEPIIGAFLAGAAFNRLIPEHSVLMNRVSFVGNTLFIPLFLISVGMLVDPGVLLADMRSWEVAVTMVVAVVTTKFLAAWVAARWFGYDRESQGVMFGLSVVQAAATLAAVLVGYELRIFDETVLNGAILMIVVTCPLGSWMVDRHGRRMAARPAPRERARSVEQRLLVSVSNPAFATKLLDLALVLRNPARPGVICPVTIVPDRKDTDEVVARGEKVLAECVSHAAAADIPVSPSLRVDWNLSDGLIRAAKENRASLVLTGWQGDATKRSRLFKSIVSSLLDECSPRLMFCRLVNPLNTTRRILFPFTPGAERRLDLRALVEDVKFLSQQIGAELRVYLPDVEAETLRGIVETARPSRPLVFVEAGSVADLRTRLCEEILPDDTVFFPSERRTGPLWMPTHESLPELLADRFPSNNLILSYPPLPGEADDPSASLIGESIHENRHPLYAVDIEAGSNLQDALVQMTCSAFEGEPEALQEAQRLLEASASAYPVPIAAGMVLLHAHCSALDRPTLLLARHAGTGWPFPGVDGTARILLALLSPKEASPDQHLKALADLARCFHQPGVTDAMTEADTVEGIAEALRNALDRVVGAACPLPQPERKAESGAGGDAED